MKKLLIPFLLMTGLSFAGNDLFQKMSFDDALTRAKEENKLVFVDFYTTWCGPCKMMDKTTFKDKDVKAWLTKNTVPLKIDAEKKTKLARKYRIAGYPSLAFINADGTTKEILMGYRPPKDFLEAAENVLTGKDQVSLAKETMEEDNSITNRLKYAGALAKSERYEEANKIYTDMIAQHDAGTLEDFTPMLAYMGMARMSRQHPAAKDFMVNRRNDLEKKVLEMGEGEDAISDYTSLNRFLREDDRSLATYDKIRAANAEDQRLKRFGMSVFPALMKANRYAEVVAIESVADRMKRSKERNAELKEKGGPLADRADSFLLRSMYDYYQIHLGLGQSKEAEAIARQALEINTEADTYNGLAWAAYLSGKPNKTALDYALKAHELSGEKNSAIIDTLARVQHQMGDKKSAYALLDGALNIFTKDGRDRKIIKECIDELKKEDSETNPQG